MEYRSLKGGTKLKVNAFQGSPFEFIIKGADDFVSMIVLLSDEEVERLAIKLQQKVTARARSTRLAKEQIAEAKARNDF